MTLFSDTIYCNKIPSYIVSPLLCTRFLIAYVVLITAYLLFSNTIYCIKVPNYIVSKLICTGSLDGSVCFSGWL